MKNSKRLGQLFLFAILMMALTNLAIQAQTVSPKTAENVAKNFFSQQTGQSLESVQVREVLTDPIAAPTFYAFNMADNGFVLVAGEEAHEPILGFSAKNKINFDNLNWNYYMDGFRLTIAEMRKSQWTPNEQTARKWKDLKGTDKEEGEASFDYKSDPVVGPLVDAIWGQEDFFNNACPVDEDGPDGKTYIGCVAVAQATTMYYWEHPAKGNGSRSYDHDLYGEQYANFGETEYQWDDMESTLDDYNPAIEQLMYHTGVSVEANWSDDYTGAYMQKCVNSLVNHFGYKNICSFVKRNNNQTGFDWLEISENDLDLDRVTMMSGFYSATSSHVWVVDGYDDDYNFHMVWGWIGECDGWYFDNGEYWAGDDWDIGYYDNQYQVYHIEPADECEAILITEAYATDIDQTEAVLYFPQGSGPTDNQFRWKKADGSEPWHVSEVNTSNEFVADDLEPGTEYVFEIKQLCSGEDWSDWSDSHQFLTWGGEVNCHAADVSELDADDIEEDRCYVYAPTPYGDVDNQWRYRPVNAGAGWLESDIDQDHYEHLKQLNPGTTYEYQFRQECFQGIWSDWSPSAYFTTLGEGGPVDPPIETCIAPQASDLYTSSVHDDWAYMYTPTPSYSEDNEFRYRINGSNFAWANGGTSSSYYRKVKNLEPGTQYEFQVRYQCDEGWGAWSDSYVFQTTGGVAGPPTEFNAGSCEDPEQDELYNDNKYVYYWGDFSKENQFRWRLDGIGSWTESSVNPNYYRKSKNMGVPSGSDDVELQFRYECDNGGWSDWSDSYTYDFE